MSEKIRAKLNHGEVQFSLSLLGKLIYRGATEWEFIGAHTALL